MGGLGARKEERRKGRKEEGVEEKGERGRKEAEAVKRILRKWR